MQPFVSNIPPLVRSKIWSNLHLQKDHPIRIVNDRIHHFFRERFPGRFQNFDHLNPFVTPQQNFDDLNIPDSHPSRLPSDSYYESPSRLLRTHTSAHQAELLRAGADNFLVSGPCFRRDTVDASHYPVFHQMEGVRLFEAASRRTADDIGQDLKRVLGDMYRHVLGPDIQLRWREDYFPFTNPSWELEVQTSAEGDWLEMLGCGVVHPRVLAKGRVEGRAGWAFGQGLERLAMVLFKIPDIRLFWSQDERFLRQFRGVDATAPAAQLPVFEPFSAYPATSRDVAFWVPGGFSEHDFHEIARSHARDLLEDVKKIDVYMDPKTGDSAFCYRLTYRSMERTLTAEEVNQIQSDIRHHVEQSLHCRLR